MLDVKFECQSCGQPIEAPAEMAGETIHCPKCTGEIRIPNPPPEIEPVETDSKPHQEQTAAPPLPPDVRIKQPKLFWRRVAAVLIDLLVLNIFLFGLRAATGTMFLATILAWILFFVVWFSFQAKKEFTIGKWLTQVRIQQLNAQTEKTGNALLRFALTWLPLLLLNIPQFEAESFQSDKFTSTFFVVWALVVLWYLAILISLLCTKGSRGIHDFLCLTKADFRVRGFLSWPRRAFACAAIIAVLLAESVYF